MPPPQTPAPAPPPPGAWQRIVTWWSRRHALGRLPFWLISRAAAVLAICAALFIANGVVIGWAVAYEVLIGITSPAKVQPAWLSWPLSILGWAAVPAFIGGAAGYVITLQIDSHQSRDFDAVLAELRARAQVPSAGERES